MTREFIPYEQALALKELGFDEPVLRPNKSFPMYHLTTLSKSLGNRARPTYQQAFRWFRAKHDLNSYVYRPDEKLNIWGYNTTLHYKVAPFKTYEEAELACLKKLIQILKGK